MAYEDFLYQILRSHPTMTWSLTGNVTLSEPTCISLGFSVACDARNIPASAAVYYEKLIAFTFLKDEIAGSWRCAIHRDAGGSLDLSLKFEIKVNFLHEISPPPAAKKPDERMTISG